MQEHGQEVISSQENLPTDFLSLDGVENGGNDALSGVLLVATELPLDGLPTNWHMGFAQQGDDLLVSTAVGKLLIARHFGGSLPPIVTNFDECRFVSTSTLALSSSSGEQGYFMYGATARMFSDSSPLDASIGFFASDQSAVGFVDERDGSVQVIREGMRVTLHQGDSVFRTDIVITGDDSGAFLRFINSLTLRLGEEERVVIADFLTAPSLLQVVDGSQLLPNTLDDSFMGMSFSWNAVWEVISSCNDVLSQRDMSSYAQRFGNSFADGFYLRDSSLSVLSEFLLPPLSDVSLGQSFPSQDAPSQDVLAPNVLVENFAPAASEETLPPQGQGSPGQEPLEPTPQFVPLPPVENVGVEGTEVGSDERENFVGSAGADTVSYSSSDSGVSASLATGGAAGDAAGDSFQDIENLGGSNHEDVLEGDDEANEIRGAGGDDSLYGDGGDDALYGNAGDDFLDGGEGDDSLYGNEGNDEISGGAGDDVLSGWTGEDELYGGAGEDVLFGNAGDDFLSGGAGDDSLSGDEGNDKLFGGSGDDVLSGWTGEDELYGGAGEDVLFGNAGDDFLSGGADDDLLGGDEGNDEISGGSGDDVLIGWTGEDKLYGNAGDDVLYGNADNDFLDGGEGNDELYGGGGDDALRGWTGADELYGGAGDDLIHGDAGNDFISGGAGDDSLYGGSGGDEISGGSNDDGLYGGTGNDFLNGGLGDDELYGDAGDDELVGGTGNDLLYGGDGNDRYVFNVNDGNDVIMDTGGSNDVFFVATGSEGYLAPTFTKSADGNDLVITAVTAQGATQEVTIVNYYNPSIGVPDFNLYDDLVTNEGTVTTTSFTIHYDDVSGFLTTVPFIDIPT